MLLVTGSTGFVGRRVVEALKSRGHSVRALVHNSSAQAVLQGHADELAYGDILDPGVLAQAARGIDGIVHLVAVVRERGSLTFERVNLQGTQGVLKAAKEAGVNRFVHVSAIGAADDPSIPFLRSKWLAEQEVITSGIPYVVIRSSLIFGEGDEFFNTLAALVKVLPVVPIVGDGRASFQPLSVEDLARCVATSCEDDRLLGKTLEVGGPQHVAYDELIDLVAGVLGKKPRKIHLPMGVVRPAATIMNVLLPKPPVTPEQLKMLKIDSTTGLSAVEDAFGFVPREAEVNVDYIRRLGHLDALKIVLGFMPKHVRDH